MGDQLERFIMDNKAAFDNAAPTDNVWNGIDQQLRKKNNTWTIVWRVAAMLFMVSTLYLLIDKNLQSSSGPEFSQEFIQAEDYYTQLISVKRMEIQEKLTPEQQEEFLSEIDQLDSMYLALKKTYQTNAANDRLVDAMISNLQLRLDILNKQLEILENIKEQTDENEPNSTI